MPVDPSRSVGDPQTRVAGTRTAELFEEHSRMVYGLCRALLRDPDDADDATQATFVSAYTSLLGGGVVREPAAWLATIARNECTARGRARMREPLPLLDADLGHTHGPEAELERKSVVAELQNAISQLPEKQREAVVLRDLYGLRYTEVSAALGMSIASVESLLFRARRSLRVSLKPLASGALTVPVAVREGIAQALPAFATGRAAGGGAASGVIGVSLLAKLAGGPAAVKAVAGLAAAVAVGSVAVVGVEHAEKQRRIQVQRDTQSQPAAVSDQRAAGMVDVASLIGVPGGSVTADIRAGREQRSGREDGTSGGGAFGARAGSQGHEGSDDTRREHGAGSDEGEGLAGTESRGDDDDAEGSGHSGHPGAIGGQSGSAGSHGGDSSGDPESREGVLDAEASHSGDAGEERGNAGESESGSDPSKAETPESIEDPEGVGEDEPDPDKPVGQGSDGESGDGPALPPA